MGPPESWGPALPGWARLHVGCHSAGRPTQEPLLQPPLAASSRKAPSTAGHGLAFPYLGPPGVTLKGTWPRPLLSESRAIKQHCGKPQCWSWEGEEAGRGVEPADIWWSPWSQEQSVAATAPPAPCLWRDRRPDSRRWGRQAFKGDTSQSHCGCTVGHPAPRRAAVGRGCCPWRISLGEKRFSFSPFKKIPHLHESERQASKKLWVQQLSGCAPASLVSTRTPARGTRKAA